MNAYSWPVVVEIVFETHALSEDNERGRATGWLPGRLSAQGRENAADMGRRRRECDFGTRNGSPAVVARGFQWREHGCEYRLGSPPGLR